MKSIVSFIALLVASVQGAFLAVDRPSYDQVVGTMKSLVDRYIAEYKEEETDFARVEESMSGVIEKAMDNQSKLRATSELQRLRKKHEARLESIATMVKGIDKATQTAAHSETWAEKFPEVKSELDRIYAAHPVAAAM